jgi:conjugative transfer signal peptidase TraF
MSARGWLLWAVAGVIAVCSPALVRGPARLVYNASPSLALGWYMIEAPGRTGAPRVGSIVLVRPPSDATLLAAQRGYLPATVPMLKRVAAAAPQFVCADAQRLRIDRSQEIRVRERDGQDRPLPVWRQCRHLVAGEIFLLGDALSKSFDSRYFGPVDASLVLGEARALWTWSPR